MTSRRPLNPINFGDLLVATIPSERYRYKHQWCVDDMAVYLGKTRKGEHALLLSTGLIKIDAARPLELYWNAISHFYESLDNDGKEVIVCLE